jgi:predicted secreted acid phosphatase
VHRFLLAALAALLIAAVAAPPALAGTTRTDTPASVITPYYDSGQWSSDIAAVVKKAKANLKKDLADDRAAHTPALVLDIDETAVFNAPCLEPVDWDLSGLAVCAVNGDGAVTPVRSLYQYARKKHVKVVFITGRPQALAGTTTDELKRLGYSSGFQLVLKPATDTQDSVIPYKSAARATVERHGYTILANVGDQLSDLAGGHSVRRYKLPNPVYLIT